VDRGSASGEFAGGESSVEVMPISTESGWSLRISAGADGLPEDSILIISVRTVTLMTGWVCRSIKVKEREFVISQIFRSQLAW
jgi:hypothetical protein